MDMATYLNLKMDNSTERGIGKHLKNAGGNNHFQTSLHCQYIRRRMYSICHIVRVCI